MNYRVLKHNVWQIINLTTLRIQLNNLPYHMSRNYVRFFCIFVIICLFLLDTMISQKAQTLGLHSFLCAVLQL